MSGCLCPLIALLGQSVSSNPLPGKTFWTVLNQGGWEPGGGGGSRTPVREQSAQSVYRCSPGTFSPRTTPPDGRPAVSPPYDLAHAPAGAGVGQPDAMTPCRAIRRPPVRRDLIREVRCLHRLGGVGVGVIVVGNYWCAAFYEASGASTCNFGFLIPVETSAPPNTYFNSIVIFHKKARSGWLIARADALKFITS